MRARRYKYVGPADIKERAQRDGACLHVASVAGLAAWLAAWLAAFLPRGRMYGCVTATFIIDTSERLWIADRRSEHVACADGQDVLAAGEVTFEHAVGETLVVDITNQSTGYCPEPECWEVVARVLARLGISHPGNFTSAFEFRFCNECGTTNLIKDEIFECVVCNSALNHAWNYSDPV